jgi:SAM-dependent methyltransferase
MRHGQELTYHPIMEDADRVWVGSMPDAYDRWLGPTVFRPFAIDLASRAASVAPQRLLELAAGTGVLTAEVRSRLPQANITATDLNAAMVDFGRTRVPDVTWRQADALDLPFDTNAFDLVACQFGTMFFPDKQKAFAEARRTLAPGGTLLLNTWGTVAEHDFAAALVTALTRAFPDDPPTFVAAVPHGYADPDGVAKDLFAAGFDDMTFDTLTLGGHAESAADVARGFCRGTPVRAAIEKRTDLNRIVSIIAAEMVAILGTGPVTGRMTAHVVAARSAG